MHAQPREPSQLDPTSQLLNVLDWCEFDRSDAIITADSWQRVHTSCAILQCLHRLYRSRMPRLKLLRCAEPGRAVGRAAPQGCATRAARRYRLGRARRRVGLARPAATAPARPAPGRGPIPARPAAGAPARPEGVGERGPLRCRACIYYIYTIIYI